MKEKWIVNNMLDFVKSDYILVMNLLDRNEIWNSPTSHKEIKTIRSLKNIDKNIIGFWKIKTNDMTPEKKAEKLLWKYLPITGGWEKEDSDVAIKCAMVVADEVMDVLSKVHKIVEVSNALNYWEEVKSEIQKL
jgi:hypothetical protein